MGEEAERRAREEGLRWGRMETMLDAIEKETERIGTLVERQAEAITALKIKLGGLAIGSAGGAVAVIEGVRLLMP